MQKPFFLTLGSIHNLRWGIYEDNKEALFDAGMSYALSQIMDLLVSDIDGIHLYTMNNPLVARKICEGIRHLYRKMAEMAWNML